MYEIGINIPKKLQVYTDCLQVYLFYKKKKMYKTVDFA